MKWQCDDQQKKTRHRQTKRKASGCRPVDQGDGTKTSRAAQRPAETSRAAQRPAGRQRPAQRPAGRQKPAQRPAGRQRPASNVPRGTMTNT